MKKRKREMMAGFYFETWNRWAEVMGWKLASDLSRSGSLLPSISMATEVRGYWSEWEGVVFNEGGGCASSLIRYEGVGHINWMVTCNTAADKERAVPWAHSQGHDESWQHAMVRHVPLDLFLSSVTFVLFQSFLISCSSQPPPPPPPPLNLSF